MEEERQVGIFKKLRYRGEWFLVAVADRLVPLIPRGGMLAAAKVLGGIGFLVDYRGRNNGRANYRIVYGDTKSEEQREKMLRESFVHFTQAQLDSFWNKNINAENCNQYMNIEWDDEGTLEKVRESGAIWLTPHYANFEWASIALGYCDLSFLIIAQKFKNPLLDAIFTKQREHNGHQLTGQKGAVLKLLRHLKKKGHVALLPDLTVRPEQASVILEILGMKVSVTKLHAELAQRTGAPILPMMAMPQEDGKMLLRVMKPRYVSEGEDLQVVCQECWDLFENTIRENPQPWLWMYKHFRYLPEGEKHEKDRGNYPDYATSNNKFNRVLKAMREEGKFA